MIMIDKLLNKKHWSAQECIEFLNVIDTYSNEEKCHYVDIATKKLMDGGTDTDIDCAESVLIYATQHYLDVSDTNYKALVYYRLGKLYECFKEDFTKAYTYYEKYALNNTINDGSHSLLLRALILRDDFTYSSELEKEFRMSLGEIDLGLRNDRIYEHLGSLIIAKHENDEKRIEDCTTHLKNIVMGDKYFFLDLVLRKDTVPDTLKVPQKVIDYINNL